MVEDQPNKLTEKQRRFIAEYLIDRNATQAAIRAGYSEDTAQEIGSENLSKPIIRNELDRRIEDQLRRAEITADKVLAEIDRLAHVDLSLAYNEDGTLKAVHAMPEDVRRAISSIETDEEYDEGLITDPVSGKREMHLIRVVTRKIRFHTKDKALEMLGKYHKLFTERHEVTGANGAPLVPPIIQFQATQPTEPPNAQ
jgi:phage terminase small subunit